MRNSGLDEAQAGIKTARRNINLRYYPYGRKQRGTEEPLDESEKGEWKSWLKTTFRKLTSWQIDGETMETVRNFILGCSKTTTDGDFSHEIKRCLFLGRKAMFNLDSILKSRDITLPTKVCLLKAMVFPSSHEQMWKLDHKESQIIDAFELWCWRRRLRVSWTARRSNQSILKETNPKCSLEWLILKLKF